MVTYPGALKTAGIGFGIGYGHIPYTSAFESVGIGTVYASAGIGLLKFIHSRPILGLLRALKYVLPM